MSLRPTTIVLAFAAFLAAPAGAQSPEAQSAAGDPVMTSTRPHQARVQDYLTRSAEQTSEEQYAFRATSEVRSFGEMLAHVADAQFYFCSVALGESSPAPADIEETHTTKASIMEVLQRSFEYCDRAYGMSDDEATRAVESGGRTRIPLSQLILNIGHNNEHYGNLVTYMRMQGVVPPSSQPRS